MKASYRNYFEMGHQIYKFKTIVRMWGMRNLAPFMLQQRPSWVSTKKKPLDTLLLHVEIRKESCNFESTNIPHLTHLVANEIQLSPLHLFQAAYKNPSWYVTINQNPNHTWSHPPHVIDTRNGLPSAYADLQIMRW